MPFASLSSSQPLLHVCCGRPSPPPSPYIPNALLSSAGPDSDQRSLDVCLLFLWSSFFFFCFFFSRFLLLAFSICLLFFFTLVLL